MRVHGLQGTIGLLVCAFSEDGHFIVAGGNDCNTYVWHWDHSSIPATHDIGDGLLSMDEWSKPQEMCKLTGHINDVLLLQFNHAGDMIATGSKDGTVRVGGPAGGMHSQSVPVTKCVAIRLS